MRTNLNDIKDSKIQKGITIRDKFYLFRQFSIFYFKKSIRLLSKGINPFETEKNKKEDISIREENFVNRFTPGEIEFYGNKFQYVDYASFLSTKKELFEENIYEFKSEKQIPFIIDCGANIGLSILFFKKLYPNSRILAFEPDRKLYDAIIENVNTYNLQNIELINKALWDEITTLKFYSEGADGGRIENISEFEENKIIEIATDKLSNYINEEIDFLKIDIEGAETKVLKECKDKLHLVKNIFIEYHSFIDSKQTLDEILYILTNSGFRYYISSIGIKSKKPFSMRNANFGMDNQLNIFGYRNEKN